MANNTLALFDAINKNNLEEAQKLIKGEVDINFKDKSGQTLLHLSASKGFTNVVEELLTLGSDLNSKSKTFGTPLHCASYYGKNEVVKILIKAEIDVDIKDEFENTPLHRATLRDAEEVLKTLIEAGANVNLKNQSLATPLHLACRYSDKPLIVDKLISAGADIHAQDMYGQTPMHQAAIYGKEEIIKILIEAGAKVDHKDKSGVTPLHQAAIYGKGEVIKIFIEAGADVNELTDSCVTPLNACIIRNETELKADTVLTLLSYDASIEITLEKQRDYFLNSTSSIFEQGTSYQRLKAWTKIFNSMISVLNDRYYGEQAKKVIKDLAAAWKDIDSSQLKLTCVAEKIGDISKTIIDLCDAIKLCSDNKHQYEESDIALYELLQKLIPELEESTNELKNHKTDLILRHIESEDQHSEFKGRIKFFMSGCNSMRDQAFLKEFIDYYPQDDEVINKISILWEETKSSHLGDSAKDYIEFC